MNEQETRAVYSNTHRDEATLGRSGLRYDAQPGLANVDEPIGRPPESEPEPRPVEPTGLSETKVTTES